MAKQITINSVKGTFGFHDRCVLCQSPFKQPKVHAEFKLMSDLLKIDGSNNVGEFFFVPPSRLRLSPQASRISLAMTRRRPLRYHA
jgi:hypothetical protein